MGGSVCGWRSFCGSGWLPVALLFRRSWAARRSGARQVLSAPGAWAAGNFLSFTPFPMLAAFALDAPPKGKRVFPSSRRTTSPCRAGIRDRRTKGGGDGGDAAGHGRFAACRRGQRRRRASAAQILPRVHNLVNTVTGISGILIITAKGGFPSHRSIANRL